MMLPICVRPERVWPKLSSTQGIRANLVYIVSLYRSRNFLTTFPCKSPNFGQPYRSRNLLTTFPCKSPTFGQPYRSTNLLTTFASKSRNFGKTTVLVIPTVLEIFY